MSTHKDFVVLATEDHPLYKRLKQLPYRFFDVKKSELIEAEKTVSDQTKLILDFTILEENKKMAFLEKLFVEYDRPIASDLSLFWTKKFQQCFPQLVGAFATVFCGQGKKFECEIYQPTAKDALSEFFKELAMFPLFVEPNLMGFTFPRTLSMIINEAYFALSENVSTKEDIDRAMKFGLNYPLGPFEWCDRIQPKNVVSCLENLWAATNDSRYRVAPLLKLEAEL